MPIANIAASAIKKYWLQDHDPISIDFEPPIKNQWETILEDDDLRLLEFYVYQQNTETDSKEIEIKWTLDGNVYFTGLTADNTIDNWIYKNLQTSNGGTSGLNNSLIKVYCYDGLDKRCLHGKLEIRLISDAGTDQIINVTVVYETLEVT